MIMELIDKSAIVAEIDRIQESTMDIHRNFPSSYDEGKFDALTLIENFINTLEVKEVDIDVDIEKEISQFIDTNFEKATTGHKISLRRTARYFYELGLERALETKN